MGCNVTVGGGSSSIRLGIYTNGAYGTFGYPTYLVADFGTASTTSTGNHIGITGLWKLLRPGWYWLAAVQQGGTAATLRTIPTGGLSYPTLMSSTSLGAASVLGYSLTAGVSGAMPAQWNSGASTGEQTAIPVLYLRLRNVTRE